MHERRAVAVRGVVQGVGFRPFIHGLALRHGLAGLVRNDAEGVHIEVEGPPEALDSFLRRVETEAPPLAVVESVTWRLDTVRGEGGFRIVESREGAHRRALVSPDVGTCAQCLDELFDPGDRRFRYPFINCTNCGPRFTIIRAVPYDRPQTTMAGFAMCAACRAEYDDPANRRFHAQPNACPQCGPQVRLRDRASAAVPIADEDQIAGAARLLRAGAVVAIKGLGGYHLAADPFNAAAVGALRDRKARQDKPFALMARDLAQAEDICRIGAEEAALLTAPGRPIVLLERRDGTRLAEAVAPRQRNLGIMLAYTPVHHLLLHDLGMPLVMTSGNRSDEPIAYRDEEAFEQLGAIADYFLVHDRPIHMRCDDSVVRVAGRAAYPVRRSRGYAPAPLGVASAFARPILACGGELKNTFCLAQERHAFLSHHIGDLENYETLRSFREGIDHYQRLFDVQPELVAYDPHPQYLSTSYARELEEAGLPAFGVQHHHAHIASCLADNERPDEERVIGVALDGTGFGSDGAIWGGEFLVGSIRQGFARRAHLEYVPMPGGEAAIRQPWRMALAHLIAVYGPDEALKLAPLLVRQADERRVRTLARMVAQRLNSPPTSSAGRLFDAVAALLDLPGSRRTTYEGQAAIELELVAEGTLSTETYPYRVRPEGETWVVETQGIIAGVAEDVRAERPVSAISARFHRGMSDVVAACCRRLREASGVGAVALSGGTFQNVPLLDQVVESLVSDGFAVYRHRRVPANDGGLALGQAVLADRQYRA